MSAARQLILRADASHQIGIGHVMRSLAIGQAWQDQGGAVTLLSDDLPEELCRRFDEEHIAVRQLEAAAGTMDDAAELSRTAAETDAEAVVIDGYHFDQRYHEVITGYGSVTLAVDDHGHLPAYRTDFILNQNPGITESLYPDRGPQTKLLLGPRYALIRREFLQNENCHREDDVSGTLRVLVTLGGSDPVNATQTIVKGLLACRREDLRVRVVLGGLHQDSGQLEQLTAGDDRFELLRSVRDMAAQYAWAEFAIAAGGSSNWEMCCFGIPRIVIVIADNQREIGRELRDAGIALKLYDGAALTADQIREDFDSAGEDPERLRIARQNSLRLVDGRGASRCVSHLLSVAESV